MMRLLNILRLPLFLIGLALFFAGERYFAAESWHTILRIAALALMVLATAFPLLLATMEKAKGRAFAAIRYRLLALWQAMVLLSPVVYLLYLRVLGNQPQPETFMQKGLLALWLLLLALGVALGIGYEVGSRTTSNYEGAPRRLYLFGNAWLYVGMMLSGLVCFNYAMDKKDKTFDWSYLKTTKPGESSEKMVKTLKQPLEMAVFYAQDNDVKPLISEYFEHLARLNPENVKLNYYDKELQPTKAEELKVINNGIVVLSFEDRHEKIAIGDSLTKARSNLKKLDSLFQTAFMALTSKTKVAYFTAGHGEMNWDRSGDSPFRSIVGIDIVLRSQNYSLKRFGSYDGSMQAVPDDAALVVIAGPTKPFLQEEVNVLKDYIAKGGNLLVLFDEEVTEGQPLSKGEKDPLVEYLAGIGLTYQRPRLVNDKQFVRATRSNVDQMFLFTNVFGTHESVQGLSRNEERVQIFLYQSGYFDIKPKVENWRNFEVVKSLSGTFADTNSNLKFDEGKEKRHPYVVGAAAEYLPAAKPKMDGDESKAEENQAGESKASKIFVLADASAVSDFVIRNPANQLLLIDAVRWLAGQSEISGAIASEEDIRIQHSKSRDLFVFHGSIFLIPLLILGAGFFATRTRKPRRKDA